MNAVKSESRSAPRRVLDPAVFGKVAVLLGGDSAEREVSLVSGDAVFTGLRRGGVDVQVVDKGPNVIAELALAHFDRVFIILHGRGGEDGTIQGALDTIGIPYTGSGVLGSALAMDKQRAKRVWQSVGVPTPDFRIIRGETDLFAAGEALGFPLAVKPVHEGSSIGVSRASNDEELHAGWFEALRYDREVIAEPWLPGPEYTAGILDDEVLPLIRLEPARGFYDYEAKYADDAGTHYHCPCGLTRAREETFKDLAWMAFEALGANGWGRVDFVCDERGDPWFLDVNTAPGMTSHSLVPMAAQAIGIDFDELVWRILEATL